MHSASTGTSTIVLVTLSGDYNAHIQNSTDLGSVWPCNSDRTHPEEAIEYALGPDCPLPDGDYVDDSVRVDDLVNIKVLEE